MPASMAHHNVIALYLLTSQLLQQNNNHYHVGYLLATQLNLLITTYVPVAQLFVVWQFSFTNIMIPLSNLF